MSLVAFPGHGKHKGNINHIEFILCPHPREPDVNGPKYPLGHIQQFGVLGMESWGQPEVTWIYFGKSKRQSRSACTVLAIREAEVKGGKFKASLSASDLDQAIK